MGINSCQLKVTTKCVAERNPVSKIKWARVHFIRKDGNMSCTGSDGRVDSAKSGCLHSSALTNTVSRCFVVTHCRLIPLINHYQRLSGQGLP